MSMRIAICSFTLSWAQVLLGQGYTTSELAQSMEAETTPVAVDPAPTTGAMGAGVLRWEFGDGSVSLVRQVRSCRLERAEAGRRQAPRAAAEGSSTFGSGRSLNESGELAPFALIAGTTLTVEFPDGDAHDITALMYDAVGGAVLREQRFFGVTRVQDIPLPPDADWLSVRDHGTGGRFYWRINR